MIKAGSWDEAVQLSYDCPIFAVGGTVEIRKIQSMSV
jgi:hypothetical protein